MGSNFLMCSLYLATWLSDGIKGKNTAGMRASSSTSRFPPATALRRLPTTPLRKPTKRLTRNCLHQFERTTLSSILQSIALGWVQAPHPSCESRGPECCSRHGLSRLTASVLHPRFEALHSIGAVVFSTGKRRLIVSAAAHL